MTHRGLQRLLLIPDNKVAADFCQIIEGAKSLQIHCCAAPKENTKLPKALSYALEEPTQPTTHAEMDRAVAVIMALISGSEGLGD